MYLQAVSQKHLTVLAKLELPHFIETAFVQASIAGYSSRFRKLSSVKCAAPSLIFELFWNSVEIQLKHRFLLVSSFGSPNKVFLLSQRNTASPGHGAGGSNIWAVFCHLPTSPVFKWAILGGRGRVLTLIKNISLVLISLVFATSGILSTHKQLVTLQRESTIWNRIIWPL